MTTPPPPAAAQPGAHPAGPGTGLLRLTLQGNVLLNMPPRVELNGQHVVSQNGVNEYHLAPGSWALDVSVQWMRRYGQAHEQVSLAPGEVIELFYAAPLHQFTTGSLGPTKQKHKGMGVFVALMIVLVVLMVCLCGGAFLTS